MEILIAEDDLTSRSLLEKIIRKIGHQPLPVKDGAIAWAHLQKNEIKMLITDWNMPNMNGITLCQNIRMANFPHYIYIIIVTGKANREDSLQGMKAGADDYIVKPFNYEEIQTRVRAGERILNLEEKYKKANMQLLQSEKMASIGQLAAGVAHEINNPTGFVSSNLKTLLDYQKDILHLIQEYRQLCKMLDNTKLNVSDSENLKHQLNQISEAEADMDIDFVLDDIMDLIKESQEGTERIKKIVIDLKDFAHPGEQTLQFSQLNQNLESCLNIVSNEIKYKAEVIKDFEELPEIECYPQQLNQVFTNLLVNAGQAIEKEGKILIQTRAQNNRIMIKIADTGQGIPTENLNKIFDPFFTTKAVGTGTGLGLHVVYNIIQKHHGQIEVKSQVGKGTEFTIILPQKS